MKNKETVLILTLLTAGCQAAPPIKQPPQGVRAQQINAHGSGGDAALRFSAVVMPDAQTPLAFRIPGYVVSLKQVRGQDGRLRDIAEGDRVARGTLLVRIRGVEYEDKVRQAASHVEAAEAVALKAKLDFERATRLFSSGSITKPDLDAARAQYDATQAQVRGAQAYAAEAQLALRDTTLVAPFTGNIVKKSVELGSFVGPGVPTFALANTDNVKIIVGVPDTAMRSVKLGGPVEVAIDAFPARTFHARISRMSSAADTVTRNFDVEVAIPNRDHLLKSGMIGSLQLTRGDGTKPTPSLVVPISAVVQAQGGKYGVFVVAASSTGEIARLRSVEVGPVIGTDITILSGLSAGDRIITSGGNLLKDGQPVEVLK